MTGIRSYMKVGESEDPKNSHSPCYPEALEHLDKLQLAGKILEAKYLQCLSGAVKGELVGKPVVIIHSRRMVCLPGLVVKGLVVGLGPLKVGRTSN